MPQPLMAGTLPRPRAMLAVAIAIAITVLLPGTARAQGRTDVVTLANGDRITGEIIRLERGRLEFKTDDAGTLYLEWDKLTSLVANRLVEVVTSDGRRFLGTLGRATDRSISIVVPGDVASLLMMEVTMIIPIGKSFWSRLDGSIDAGFSYTRSSGVAQLNVNSDTVFRRPASETRLTASLTQTEKDDGSSGDDRGTVEFSYFRYRWQEWYVSGVGRFESNQSLGIELRSQAGFTVGPRLINSNRAQLVLGAGVAVNNEDGVDVESTQNVEAILMFRTAYFTYDRPKTTLDIKLLYYPSLSDFGRQRVQFDASAKRELWKDFFASVNVLQLVRQPPAQPDR